MNIFSTQTKSGQSLLLWLASLLLFILPATFLHPAYPERTDFQDKELEQSGVIQPVFKKILEITDENAGDSFYLKYPREIKADSNQNIYVLDGRRLLLFSSNGQFVRNLVKKGQGPGEASHISGFHITDKNVIINNNQPSKIMWFDKDGRFLKELRLKGSEWLNFVFYSNDEYYFTNKDLPTFDCNGENIDINHNLLRVSANGTQKQKLQSFPVKTFYLKKGKGRLTAPCIALFLAFTENNHLFASFTQEYNINIVDLKKNQMSPLDSIGYQREPIPEELRESFPSGSVVRFGKIKKAPPRKYYDDIRYLLVHKNKLWAVTSRTSKEKGIRVDVYDTRAEFNSSFWMKLPGLSDSHKFNGYIKGDYLYVIDKNKCGDYAILKYQIKRL